ncbi:Cof-type HAD-IIB family hydrolase [Spiroplasma floricola]|uniref:HAD family hydrolase n=1 Tax=Spiroplasma floricola 23-6 TaxID=1336749 RepID=A0A2K8SDL4_9MOLU|nr:Cof-type HAD-IIB family hydrolase [Spiroplasma floricola]AUB31556.1 HAD family hydrolase [Spiroplasma floricola 23-6]
MKDIKSIAATDMDGTIIYEWDRISEENKKQLLKFQKKSNKSLTLVTGRNYFMADFAAKELDIALPVICSNGASVINPKTFEYVAKNHFSKEEIKELLEHFLDTNIDICISNDFRTHYIKEDDWQDLLMGNQSSIDFSHFPNAQVLFKYDNLEHLIKTGLDHDESFPVIVANTQTEQELKMVLELVKKYNLLALEFPKEGSCRVEIFKNGVTKSWGLNALLDHVGLTKENIHVFGDEHNDYPMFKDFPNCYAIGNAIEGIKDLAKEVIDTVQNAGVGKKLNEMIEEFQ